MIDLHSSWLNRTAVSLKLLLVVCVGTFALLTLPGCGGCLGEGPASRKKREEIEAALKKKKQEQPKPDFEMARLVVQPSDDTLITKNLAKPGHWVTLTQRIRANHLDWQAEIQSYAVDQDMRPLVVEHTPFHMEMWRPASLPKGQVKQFEMTHYIPRRPGYESRSVWLESHLRARNSGRDLNRAGAEKMIPMPDYQYLLLVLSSNPDRYGYLKRLDSIRPPRGADNDGDRLQHYRVLLPKIERRVPLPAQPLAWTSIAYIVWDDLAPTALTPDQENAILDWLHWGGQILVSGPDSLGALSGSFLDKYLPAKSVKSVALGPAAFAELNDFWSLPERELDGARRGLTVIEGKPLVGIQLQKHPDAQYLPRTGNLVVERSIGRGRIVVTAFHLSDRPIVNWRNFDGFFNACLLRRPPRVFSKSADRLAPQMAWAEFQGQLTDPRLVSTLRYFSRDMGHSADDLVVPSSDRSNRYGVTAPPRESILNDQEPRQTAWDSENNVSRDEWHFGGYQCDAVSGVCGWNDTGGAASAARESLKEAAGISVPKADFVLRVLAIYLVVLVPLNWGFFYMLGRVEWAWVAAPVIAIIGTAAVVRLAQLDIGFARSRTEIGVLEAYGEYPRGHLTRYTALYTSLSSSYNILFEDEYALAQPFAVDPGYQRHPHESVGSVSFWRERGVSLRGFTVRSNSTGIIHSEQMVNLGGALQLTMRSGGGFQVANHSNLTLRDVGVLHRSKRADFQVAWLGTLRAKTAMPIQFQNLQGDRLPLKEWEQSVTMTTNRASVESEVGLWRLLDLATRKLTLREREVRLIGWTSDELPGMSIRPHAAQQTLRTLVVVHLRPGALPEARPDVNCKTDITADDDHSFMDDDVAPLNDMED